MGKSRNIANRSIEEQPHSPRRMPGLHKTWKPYPYLIRYYVASLLGQKRPLLGGIKLTHACNLSCTQCPFRQREAPSLSFRTGAICPGELSTTGA